MSLSDLAAATEQVAETILLLGPGFLLLKAVAVTGGQPQRLQWEWAVWSILLSLPIAAITLWLVPIVADGLRWPGLRDWEPPLRFVLAVVAGILLGLLLIRVRRSRRPWVRRVYRAIVDSAWDLVLDDATHKTPDGKTRGLELTVEEAGGLAIYYGTLSAFGYERTKAEPWIYLTYPRRWEGEAEGYVELDRTEGLLVHRDQIKRLRVIRPPTAEEEAADAKQAEEIAAVTPSAS
jgi:hypothetical protein